MKYLDTKPQSLEEAIVKLRAEKDMSGMCCKNCGDMFGKPTAESSCQYNAYNPMGDNWIKKESYKEEVELDEVTNEKGDLNTAADDFEKAAGKQLMDKAKFLKIAALLRKGDTKAVAKIAKSSTPKSRLAIGDYMADNIGPKKASKLLGFKVEEVELKDKIVEAKKSDYQIYHKDFSSAMQHAYAVAKKRGYTVDENDIDNKVASGPKKPSSGKTNRYILGTDKKKNLHVQVANLDNKRFELNMYIESIQEVELDEAKVECPECEGKGCNHCDDKGYHMKEEFITEEEIDPQIKRLFRMGLVSKDEMQKALRAFKNPEKSMQNKELRAIMMKVLQKVLKTVENDPSLFQKMKGSLKNVSETVIDEKLDPVNKKAVKKDFDDRKDKDIDNDGDVDDSDEYLHKKRKAISKAMKKEETLQKINNRIKENKAKYDGRTREGKSFVERINNGRLKREEKKQDNKKEMKTMTDKPANNIKIHGSYNK